MLNLYLYPHHWSCFQLSYSVISSEDIFSMSFLHTMQDTLSLLHPFFSQSMFWYFFFSLRHETPESFLVTYIHRRKKSGTKIQYQMKPPAEIKHRAYSFLEQKKLSLMAFQLGLSIVTRVCFIDHLVAPIALFATIALSDSITIVHGLASASDCVITDSSFYLFLPQHFSVSMYFLCRLCTSRFWWGIMMARFGMGWKHRLLQLCWWLIVLWRCGSLVGLHVFICISLAQTRLRTKTSVTEQKTGWMFTIKVVQAISKKYSAPR